MTRHLTRLVRLRALGLVGLVALLPLPGCTHDLLQVTDPDIIPDVNTPSGALALKNGVIFRLEQVTAGLGGNGPHNLFIFGGVAGPAGAGPRTARGQQRPAARRELAPPPPPSPP